MEINSRRRTIVLAVLAGSSAALAALAVVWPQWIEALGIKALGLDPDQGTGALEWAIPLALAVAAGVLAMLAGYSWHKYRALAQLG